MNSTDQRILPSVRDLVVSTLLPFDPAVIYLFGSFGTPAQHASSDVDIAFLPGILVSPMVCFEVANRLAQSLGREVDLIDLSQASTVLRKEVLRTGIPLAVANLSRRDDFEMRTLADYARLNEERRPVLIALGHDG